MYDPGVDRHEWAGEWARASRMTCAPDPGRRACPSWTGSWRGCSRKSGYDPGPTRVAGDGEEA